VVINLIEPEANGAAIPSGFKSNVMETSVGTGGRGIFMTGNWFAASSGDGGGTWSYVNPYADFSSFCCDQLSIYDASRDAFYWLRQGLADQNGNGVFRISVLFSADSSTVCNYDFAPSDVNSAWTGQWFDYPHMQLGADFLYIAYNVFNASDQWQRTVMLRLPLDVLGFCNTDPFTYNYYANSSWFTFVPVQGADHVMYFASNRPNVSPFNRVAIWRWDEAVASPSSVVRTVTAWKFTSRGQAQCGSTTGNWTARYDDRLLAGVRHSVQGTAGRVFLTWFWNARQGGSFPNPYIEAVTVDQGRLVLPASVPSNRPLVWSSTTCFAYPSAAVNNRGDIGLVVNSGTGTDKNPDVAFALADDNAPLPPTWNFTTVISSNGRPTDNRWGDYNTTRVFEPSGRVWVASSHYLTASGASGTGVQKPIYFVYGRERDMPSFLRWSDK
jgi:hypothetical protein